MFNHKYQIRPAFYLDPPALKRRFMLCGVALFHAKHLRYEIFQTISWTPRLDASCQVSFAAKAACATYFIGPRGHTATQSVPPWALSFRDKCGLGFVFASGFLMLCCIFPDGHFASSMSFRISMSDEWVHPMRRQNRT